MVSSVKLAEYNDLDPSEAILQSFDLFLVQYFIGRAKNISFWIFLQWKLILLTVLIKHNLICAL